jgi:HPt (histidine-containing phosphotransfer) domain-containing protein
LIRTDHEPQTGDWNSFPLPSPEKIRCILGQFGCRLPGYDEPTDEALDDEEIHVFREEIAELVHDIEKS